eukprot:TRINITY_DN13713_c0_g1_i3.p1 TRINITY_DN13713_c0_g1~~TRINITY_DN13713_c0_g1_i3.p1  ORF type:complete len:209 (-),score=9.98 TRINITY_DN13713_c0_g1_i3:50-676(-)
MAFRLSRILISRPNSSTIASAFLRSYSAQSFHLAAVKTISELEVPRTASTFPAFSFPCARYSSTLPANSAVVDAAIKNDVKNEENKAESHSSATASGPKLPSDEDLQKLKEKGLVYSRYWGIAPAKLYREDGSPWPWNCFMPWETYSPDVSIDLKKHHVPSTFLDKFAYWTVKLLRLPTDIFFQRFSTPGKVLRKPLSAWHRPGIVRF